MSFRRRLTLVAAVAVGVAVVAASAIVYLVVRHELRDQVDSSLTDLAAGATVEGIPLAAPPTTREALAPAPLPGERRGGDGHPRDFAFALPQAPPGVPGGLGQLVGADGDVLRAPGKDPRLPVGEETRAVAAGERDGFFSDADVGGSHLRILTEPAGPGMAVQVARSLDETEAATRRIGILLIVVAAGGIALAALLGRGVANAAIAPVARLSEATDHVARTRDLTRRIEVGDSDDELARLAASFNAMLAELESSEAAQRQLVADASHELRTPLTSLRTNLEVLATAGDLDHGERRALLADAVAQLGELGMLVGNLVDLARDEEPVAATDVVSLDAIVAEAVERAARNAPACRFESDIRPCMVRGVSERLDRAVGNLLDNAAKWSPSGGRIDVMVGSEGTLTVRDRGPGIAPEDLPHVFDRFYRATDARGKPGSGLGLAIVRQIVAAHDGTVTIEPAPGGGTVARVELPVVHASELVSADSSGVLS